MFLKCSAKTFCAGVTVNVCEDHLIYFIPLFTDRYAKTMTHYGLNLTELADKQVQTET